MREKTLDRKILKYCEENNIWATKIWGGGYQSSGIPDIIGCANGYFFAFEDKVDNNKLSKLQEYHIDKIHKAKGIAYEIRNFEDAKKILIDLTNRE